MGDDPQAALDGVTGLGPGTEGRSKAVFVLGEGAFHMPAVAIDTAWKAFFHLATVAGPRPGAEAAAVEGDDRRTDAQDFAGQAMVVLGVEAGLGQEPVDRPVTARWARRRSEARRILAGPLAHHRGGEQVAVGMTDDRQLGPEAAGMGPASGPPDAVARNVAVLRPGCVQGRLRPFVDQATRLGSIENGMKQGVESPFLAAGPGRT